VPGQYQALSASLRFLGPVLNMLEILAEKDRRDPRMDPPGEFKPVLRQRREQFCVVRELDVGAD
jgi:hypothetical protein